MSTFPQLLARLATERPDEVALQEKRYGIWEPLTWSSYDARVRDFAHGLAALGVERGQVVAVLGDNRPEWLIAELAAQTLGAAVVGIFPTSINEELRHILTLARVRVVVAEDQEQVDKLLRLRRETTGDRAATHDTKEGEEDSLLAVETVIFYDPHGLESYNDPCLLDFTEVEALGRELASQRPGWIEAQRDESSADDIAIICTTSGTTSRPKLGELSHANLLAMAEHLTTVDPIGTKDRYVSFLPFAWIGEQMLAVACGLSQGLTISFPDDASTQRADLREIGPNVMFSPPRIWESMLSEVQVRIDEAGWLKRTVFGWGYEVGDRVAGRRVKGARPGLGLALAYRLADVVALRPVRDQLGLARIRRCYTGGAPLGPDVFRFFHAIGVNLKQIYGQTEICGIAVVHRDDAIAFNTVGTPIPGTELRFTDDGEILLRSASVFRGYHRQPEVTAETVDQDGWLHTGDAGYLDEAGQLVVIDRAKDVLQTEDGTRFSSAFIENKLKFSPYVEEAVTFFGDGGFAVGDGAVHGGMTALVTLDPLTVGSWAEHQHLSYTTYTDLAAKPGVYDLVAEEVDRANQDLPESIRIQRFVILHKQFDPDDDEITRTRKVRRSVINERYADIITALDRAAHHRPADLRPDQLCRSRRSRPPASLEWAPMSTFLSLTVYGLADGAILALAALGFVLIYKATSVINFAQGEFLLVGAYTFYAAFVLLGLPIVLASVVGVVLAVGLGIVVERFVLRPLIGESPISVIMVTIGLSAVLRAVVQMFFGTAVREQPSILPRDSIKIFGGQIPLNRLLVIAIAAFVLTAFTVFFQRSRHGIAMRAVADDQQAALTMGISVRRIFAMAWALAAVSALIAGVLLADVSAVEQNIASFGLIVFPVVILGGLDSVPGTIVGGLTIGLLKVYVSGYADPGLAEVIPYVVLVVILMVRPYGLFGETRIERV